MKARMLFGLRKRYVQPVVGMVSVLFAILLVAHVSPSSAARPADVISTKHNLSSGAGNALKSTNEDEVCVFCHTPHGASTQPGAPLWNKALSGETYTPYQSNSLDATDVDQPSGKTRLCLSCHDGTLGIASMSNEPGSGADTGTTNMQGVAGDGSIAAGSGSTTGFTRDLGIDLSNDHPVSFTYDDTLASTDGELRLPSDVAHIGVPTPGVKPIFPLDNDSGPNQMHCTTCHDPHVKGKDVPSGTTVTADNNVKFLRAPRFQMETPNGGTFDEAAYDAAGNAQDGDIICLGCHDRDLGGTVWSNSVHAKPGDANEKYSAAAANQREFPANIQVWQAACLNCHDTHTVQGARRLLREGTDSASSIKAGGKSAIEETCYQCHTDSARTILQANTTVPNIEDEFARPFHMPIVSGDGVPTYGQQTATTEQHDIGFVDDWPISSLHPSKPTEAVGANFVESPVRLGFLSNDSRHAECTDCHNPHRIVKNSRFDGTGVSTQATHKHVANPLEHNAAPGALKGTYGVEIDAWNSTAFGSMPTNISVRCGVSATDCDGNDQVTKEYQVCLKCHSNYAYADSGEPDGAINTGRPATDGSVNSANNATSRSRYVLENYTNQAMEFQSPDAHVGENTNMTGSGASPVYDTASNSNHRSWHPVMKPTGRTIAVRRMANNKDTWSAPWKGSVGAQTMMCSDCHNNGNGNETSNPGSPGGPHGSNNFRLLRGAWNSEVVRGGTGNNRPFCVDCHGDGPYWTGDKQSGSGWKHTHENNAIKCNWCHIAIPHGWKNKSFLANLNDIGPEVTCGSTYDYDPPCTPGQPVPVGTEVYRVKGGSTISSGEARRFYKAPYYNGSILGVIKFKNGWNEWDNESVCGSDRGNKGEDWMGDMACGS